VETFRAMLVGTPAEGYAGCCEALADVDLRDRLAAIEAPTLVVTGAGDPVAPPETGAQLAASISGARHVTVAGARHITNAEQPATFTQHVLAHLTEEKR
jgi:3-oxoadipate enol-lactonase